jgi:hypothetical protein
MNTIKNGNKKTPNIKNPLCSLENLPADSLETLANSPNSLEKPQALSTKEPQNGPVLLGWPH